MRLTVIGCSGSVPGPTSAASCYLVEAEGFALVLDLGSGAFGPLQRVVDVTAIDTLLLSHLHADHVMDVTALVVALQHGPSRRSTAVPVLGPSTTSDRFTEVFGLHTEEDAAELARLLAVGVVTERSWAVGPFAVTARRVDHPVEAYGYRIEHAGRSLVYSGDCAPCPGLDELARGADLLLVEAAYAQAPLDGPANPPGIHHTGREAGELAARSSAGRLVVTHVPPWHDPATAVRDARSAFAGPVEAAVAGAVWTVGSLDDHDQI